MELQLALDMIGFEEGLKLAEELRDLIDILELGTPFSLVHPLTVLKTFKEALPGLKILSDFKIMDAGYGMARLAFEAGADIVTVSARTWDITIQETIKAARDYGRQVHVDMMSVPDDQIGTRGRELDALGPDYIGIHRAVSIKGASPEQPLRIARSVVNKAKLTVAGGIDGESLKRILPLKPDLVIVGSAITKAKDPRAAALEMRKIMEGMDL
jgi:3-hexulose-6-phosphate synthase